MLHNSTLLPKTPSSKNEEKEISTEEDSEEEMDEEWVTDFQEEEFEERNKRNKELDLENKAESTLDNTRSSELTGTTPQPHPNSIAQDLASTINSANEVLVSKMQKGTSQELTILRS